MTDTAGAHVEEIVDYEVTFAQLGPLRVSGRD
jgi:hypothetical protein